ncbi:peptide deformylase [Wenjunlia tyrosinilytica]|uniref:Peptide deformylase n=1 Tax=Wenjunlia tyrosinilytica TaxID=1544741 RepID=A0A918DVK4_9ACTN|nr:peptide deformylase [Wenjunlia tyrosinilytica]GGO83942.1 peptide deformylase 2 [Wenjunlia tyrosinilytica]
MARGTIPGSTGSVHPLRLLGDSVLRGRSEHVTEFDESLEALVESMFASMYAADGVGLAANQVGVAKRVFVYDCPDDEDRRHLGHIVNPRLVETAGVMVTGEEGCLSVPGVRARTPRYDIAVVEGFDSRGEPVRVTGTGFFARCLQHECGHLEGGLFLDHLSGLTRIRAERAVRRAPWYTA